MAPISHFIFNKYFHDLFVLFRLFRNSKLNIFASTSNTLTFHSVERRENSVCDSSKINHYQANYRHYRRWFQFSTESILIISFPITSPRLPKKGKERGEGVIIRMCSIRGKASKIFANYLPKEWKTCIPGFMVLSAYSEQLHIYSN